MNIFHQTFSCRIIYCDFYLNINYINFIKFNLHCKKKKKKHFLREKYFLRNKPNHP